MTNARLRERLQRCESRQRLALQALEAMQRAVLGLGLSIEQTSLIVGHVRSVRLVLEGEVIP
jgi:hypothetical protein